MANVFGVIATRITKQQLLNQISEKITSKSRLSLYFLYSEFVIRANRLPAYKEVLNQATWTAVDGRGLMWSLWSLKGENVFAWIYSKILQASLIFQKKLPKPLDITLTLLRLGIFLILFVLNLILNLILGFITIAGKYRFIARTQTEIILGRDSVWDILQIANDKNLKVAIVGGSEEGDKITKHLIEHLFPNISLHTWVKPRNSNLIDDIPKYSLKVNLFNNFFPWVILKNLAEIIWKKFNPQSDITALDPNQDVLENLNSDNICQFYPDLYDAKDFLRQTKADMVLLCLGGGSGKQEFFAQHIKQDQSIDFGFMTGLGAAIDYLGGEKSTPPKWICQMGLEWVYRLIHQPYRRLRIIDDILTLWWWTTLQQFLDYLDFRPTVVAKVKKSDEYLMVKRRSILPGDVGWTFVQGGIEAEEDVVEAAKRELCEEVGLNPKHLKLVSVKENFAQEIYPVSLFRTLLLGGQFQGSETSTVEFEYIGLEKPHSNWENLEAKWMASHQVLDYLSQEKKIYF